jgi:integrase
VARGAGPARPEAGEKGGAMPTATRRRGWGEGSLSPRPNGKWLAQLSVGGHRLSKTFTTKSEALQWLRAEQARAQAGLLTARGRQPLGAYLDEWLEAIRASVRPKSWVCYQALLQHARGRLGAVRLVDLRADHLQRLYSELLAAGRAPKTVRLLHSVLHKALGDAVRWGLVSRNVADAAVAPRVPRRAPRVWTAEEARRFLQGVRGERWEAAYVLALLCGLRGGELAGLRWEAVDLGRGVLRVERIRARAGRLGTVEGEPKTASSRRLIPLPGPAVEALKRRRQRQLEERLLAGGRWQETGYVFTGPWGAPTNPDRLREAFCRAVARLGLPRIRLHALRHTCATLLLQEGTHPKLVQELLGHSTIGQTLDTYSHVLPGLAGETARAMERALASVDG